jgi:isoquinoline 1-oxidoreductase beta subunit
MKKIHHLPRREFIRLTAMSGACLAIGLSFREGQRKNIVNLSSAPHSTTSVNAFIFIEPSGKITIFNHRPEMGQGTFESIPMIIAEELEVDIDKVEILPSPANRSKYGDQMVVGSHSIQGNFEWMRKVGASAREMLITAASQRWGVNAADCYAENAFVINRVTGNKIAYADLAADAGKLPIPESPQLKDPKNFKIIGKSILRRDIPMKVNGEAVFGIDCDVPDMLYASVERSAVLLGKVISFNDSKARAVPGVTHVLKTQRTVFGRTREGVAVIATNYWAALQGRKLLEIQWDNGNLESWSTKKIKNDYQNASTEKGVVFHEYGNFDQAFSNAINKIEASYETPYQTHAPMEPMNTMVHVQKDKCEYWGSTQNPNGVRSQLAQQCGVPEDKVIINYTFMGGAFGRRSMTDIAEEAADLSMKTNKPVKVIWTREDDISQGPFRACSLNVCRGAVDQNGNVIALEHKVICQDIRNQSGDSNRPTEAIAGGINREYSIPNFALKGILQKFYIPVSYWRSVYHSTNCFAHESFIDELAFASKKDPLDFRLSMLQNHRRYTQVLHAVADKTNWSKPVGKDEGKGVAIVERSGAFVAMVVEIRRENGKAEIKKITAAVDCGLPVNPDIIKAQTEGCIVMGLTATYKSGLTIENGGVAEQNFDRYKMLRLNESPEIDVIVINSTDSPEGVGEAGLPTVAPALTNAIFSLTGKRIRVLPFSLDEI